MANQTLSNVTILLRNDTAANWTSENPVLSKGEVGIEIDTSKFKIGDGTKDWSQLSYAGTVVAASNTNGHIAIDGVDTTVYTLPAGGSALGGVKTTSSGTGTVKINSGGTMQLNVVNPAITAGTYTKLTVNAQGLVTGVANVSASDIPTLTLAKISDAGTAASKNTGTSSGNVPILDSNGKLDTSVLPALAISETYTAATQAAMLALTAQQGDICIRTDQSKTYILSASPASTLANWKELVSPADAVSSVNNKTGAVTLTTSDISEGTNLYYTQARFNTAFAAKASTGLSDSAKIIRNDDTLIIDCGNA